MTNVYDVEVEAYCNPAMGDREVIKFKWTGNIGWGEYTLYTENGQWYGDSECMDRGENKEFLKKLFDKIIEQIKIEG